jgi:iron complex transport system substrate-binding protein
MRSSVRRAGLSVRVPFVAVVLLGLVACSESTTRTPDGQRIISLTPSVTRILDALGARGELVGLDEMSRRIRGMEGLPSVGGLFSPDMERMVALRPTVVIAVRTEQQSALLGQLRSRGVRVEQIEPYTLEEVLASFVDVARWIGSEKAGRDLVARVRADLGTVRRSVEGRVRPTTALVVERDPLYVVGAGSFAHALVGIAGGVNVFSDLDAPYPRVSLEVLADRAPDVILDTGVDPARAESDLRDAREFWSRFAWVRRVEVVPRGPITMPGPDLAVAAQLLSERLHPEAGGAP